MAGWLTVSRVFGSAPCLSSRMAFFSSKLRSLFGGHRQRQLEQELFAVWIHGLRDWTADARIDNR